MRVEILSFNMRWIAYSLPLCSLAHPAGYGLVPGQRLRHSSCVHHVRSGAELQRRDDGVIAAVHPDEPGQETLYAPCAHADKVPGNAISSDMAVAAPAYIANGYVTSAWVTNDTNIPADGVGRLDAQIYTPTLPSDLDAGKSTVFLWVGTEFESKSTVSVLQPVLSVGPSAAGGPPRTTWGAACWYVGPLHTFVSDFIDVSASEVVDTSMVLKDGKWTVSAAVGGSNATLTVSAAITLKQSEALVAMEAFQISKCSQYPNQYGTYFNNLQLQSASGAPFSPQWFTHDYVTACNSSTTIHQPSYVSMYWNPTL